MWKASAGHKINENIQPDDDDWETDPDFVNDVNEQEQRWGSKTIEGSGRTAGSINMQQLREETENADAQKKKKEIEEINPGYGYGGKYGVQTDRMDKSAVGHDYVGKVEKHASQKDYSDGFGGKYGVQTDRVDKSAVSWDHIEKVEKHSSQKDYATGFGGKFGVQTDRVDKSAVGWDHIEKVEKHESQKDYAKGFGGKFGVEEDRKDKSAVGWDYIEAPQKHESQLDHKVGFGGKFGVQKDRVDKSAVSWDHIEKVEKHSSQKDYAAGFGGKFGVQSDRVDKSAVGWDHIEKVEKHESQKGFDVKQCIDKSVKSLNDNKEPSSENVKTEKKNFRAQFENLAKNSEDENRKKTEEQKRLREIKDKQDLEQASKKTIVENTPQMTTEEVITTTRKIAIDTGRSGGIGNAISAFNQMQSPTVEQPVQRKEQIKLPKQIEQPQIQPNVIPDVIQDVVEPKPVRSVQFLNDANKTAQKTDIESVDRDIHTAQSINIKSNQPEAAHESIVEPPLQFTEVNDPIYQNQEELNEQSKEEAIYQNQDDFIEYIEDTGVKAIALYDYQAAADDEISFDPDDIITHIEMIDEGWWRGMCKNRYGLFPANYVQLVEQQQT